MANSNVTPGATRRWLDVTAFAGRRGHDTTWWRAYWKRISAEGVLLPSDAVSLADAARQDGLRILGRISLGVLSSEEIAAHPEWAAVDRDGKPLSVTGGVAACINRGYFTAEAPRAVRTLAERLRADGVLGFGWSGLDRSKICYCADCERGFRASGGGDLPAAVNMDQPTYWAWVDWNVRRRNAMWAALDAQVRQAGATTYGWSGMVDVDRLQRARRFEDVREIAKVAKILFVEDTTPSRKGRFRLRLDDSRYLTSLFGARPVIAFTPTHEATERAFALTSAEPSEIRLRLLSSFAGGAGGAVALNSDPLLDRRATDIAPPVMDWERKARALLIGRAPAGSIGLVWSSASADRYGRAQAHVLSDAPYRGMVAALTRAHFPYRTLDAEDLTGDLSGYAVLILPNVASMSDAQINAVRAFARAGGALIATGETSLYDAAGEPRADFGLADVFGARRPRRAVDRLAPITPIPWTGPGRGAGGSAPGLPGSPGNLGSAQHDYVRLRPQLAGSRPGPHPKGEPNEPGTRHPVLAGFDDTDLLPYGGNLAPLTVDADRVVAMTFIPPIPSLPPDEAYIREDKFDSPGLIVGAYGRGRVVFMPADFDRRLGMDPIIDHYNLVANTVRWALGNEPTLSITGRAIVASALYQQGQSLVLHLVNLTGADNQVASVVDFTPVGPLRVNLPLPEGLAGRVEALGVSAQRPTVRITGNGPTRRLEFELASLLDHQVVVVA